MSVWIGGLNQMTGRIILILRGVSKGVCNGNLVPAHIILIGCHNVILVLGILLLVGIVVFRYGCQSTGCIIDIMSHAPQGIACIGQAAKRIVCIGGGITKG